jgi:hypothetical protein
MSLQLFDVIQDEEANAWFLRTPRYENGEEILGAEFRRGKRWNFERALHTNVYAQGNQVTWSFGGRNTSCVASHVMTTLRSSLPADCLEGVPIQIAGCSDQYEILNVLDIVDCVDEDQSEFGRWTQADGRPDMVGRYRGIPRMVLDSKRALGHDLFLVKNWEVVMVCSSRIRDLLIDQGVTGIKFAPIETS